MAWSQLIIGLDLDGREVRVQGLNPIGVAHTYEVAAAAAPPGEDDHTWAHGSDRRARGPSEVLTSVEVGATSCG
jgi:hypothetical protein